MAKNTDEKLSILEAVKAFAKDDISKAGINLFSTLGYDTSLQAPLDDKTYQEFKETQYDLLADGLREHLDMKKIYEILEEGV